MSESHRGPLGDDQSRRHIAHPGHPTVACRTIAATTKTLCLARQEAIVPGTQAFGGLVPAAQEQRRDTPSVANDSDI
jgi:hypothetical protein